MTEGFTPGTNVLSYKNNNNIFTAISHADRGTINMKHIKSDFRFKACVRPAVSVIFLFLAVPCVCMWSVLNASRCMQNV